MRSRERWILGLPLLLAAVLASPAIAAAPVALQPLGAVDRTVVEGVAARLRSLLPAEVVILPPRPLPDAAYYPPRRRYRGAELIASLDRETPAAYLRVIGITGRDISVTRGPAPDWGVFGVARLRGRAGIVSTYRLGAGAHPGALLETRLENVVLHELGHTFGLRHCEVPGCVMRDAEGSLRPVDASSGKLCPDCASLVEALLGRCS